MVCARHQKWTRGAEWARLILPRRAPKQMNLMAIGGSIGTTTAYLDSIAAAVAAAPVASSSSSSSSSPLPSSPTATVTFAPDHGVLRAPLVLCHSFEELDQLGATGRLHGAVVVFQVPFTTYGVTTQFRKSAASRASPYGAVGVLVRSVTPFSLDSPHTGTMTQPQTLGDGTMSFRSASLTLPLHVSTSHIGL
jgi:hypothetical protein